MNGILKTKQEELLKLKSEIMDKEENLSLLEPGLKQLMESTKPLLSGLELELGSLSEKMQFEHFDEEMTDSLMCLYRQCRARETNKNDVLVKYQGSLDFIYLFCFYYYIFMIIITIIFLLVYFIKV